MDSEYLRRLPFLEWGVADRPMPGETESGDQYLVQPLPAGTLVAVVDGLGHGAAASAAAKTAVATLRDHAEEPLIPLVNRCHHALRDTNGAVISLAWFQSGDQTLTWLGVGNVECLLLRADATARPERVCLLPRGGVVGYQIPPLRATVVPVAPNDLLLLATDGIHGHFTERLNVNDSPQQIADDIMSHYGKETDDALVLVARFDAVTLARETPHDR